MRRRATTGVDGTRVKARRRSSGGMRVWTLQRPATLTQHAAGHGSTRQRNAKRSFAGRIPKRSLGTTEDEVFARHRGIIAQGSGLRAASGEDGTRGLVPGYAPPQERTARGG